MKRKVEGGKKGLGEKHCSRVTKKVAPQEVADTVEQTHIVEQTYMN